MNFSVPSFTLINLLQLKTREIKDKSIGNLAVFSEGMYQSPLLTLEVTIGVK